MPMTILQRVQTAIELEAANRDMSAEQVDELAERAFKKPMVELKTDQLRDLYDLIITPRTGGEPGNCREARA